MKLFKMGKNVKIKISIWLMLGEIVENAVGEGFIFYAIAPAHCNFDYCNFCYLRTFTFGDA